jgi:hypothetical protein
MSFSVDVRLAEPLTPGMLLALNKEFEHYHRVHHIKNRRENRHLGKAHGLDVLAPDYTFVYIPCHWNFEHMNQTASDIQNVVERLGLSVESILQSY